MAAARHTLFFKRNGPVVRWRDRSVRYATIAFIAARDAIPARPAARSTRRHRSRKPSGCRRL